MTLNEISNRLFLILCSLEGPSIDRLRRPESPAGRKVRRLLDDLAPSVAAEMAARHPSPAVLTPPFPHGFPFVARA